MNPSYLYHAFGVRHQECTKTEYKGNQKIHYMSPLFKVGSKIINGKFVVIT